MDITKAELEQLLAIFTGSRVYGPKSGITEARRVTRYLTLMGEDEEHYKGGPLTREQLISLDGALRVQGDAPVVHVDAKDLTPVAARDRRPEYVSVPARAKVKRTGPTSLYKTPLKQPLANGLTGTYADPVKRLRQPGIKWVKA